MGRASCMSGESFPFPFPGPRRTTHEKIEGREKAHLRLHRDIVGHDEPGAVDEPDLGRPEERLEVLRLWSRWGAKSEANRG